MTDPVGTILVSAHPDDVALSIGGSILAGFFRRPLLLVTVFSYGGWAPYYHGSHGVDAISALRAKEDERFAKAIGSRLMQLDMNDAAMESMFGEDFNMQRWLSSVVRGDVIRGEEVVSGFESGLGELAERVPRVIRWSIMERLAKLDRAYLDVKRRLSRVLVRYPDAVLVSPLALGLHPDHVLVARACRSLAESRVCYYEDLPYARAYGLAGIQRHVSRFERRLRPVWVDINSVINVKLENLRLYPSQLDSPDFVRVLRHAKSLGTDGRFYERIWTTPQSAIDFPTEGRPRSKG
jgi:LmbE family N-acetylglucosaminyl deacetylase